MATTNLEAPAPFHIETGPVDLKAIGSIHTQQDRMGSVTYRTTVATIAMNATDAVGHCPPLPADNPSLVTVQRHRCAACGIPHDVDRVVAHGVDHSPRQGREDVIRLSVRRVPSRDSG